MNEMTKAHIKRLERERDEARRELAVVIKDRDSWERRVRQLEAQRKVVAQNRAAKKYKFGGEGVA